MPQPCTKSFRSVCRGVGCVHGFNFMKTQTMKERECEHGFVSNSRFSIRYLPSKVVMYVELIMQYDDFLVGVLLVYP